MAVARGKKLERNINYVRDMVYTTLTLAEYTKVPVLFMGNPGIAKTTGVRLWSKLNNYEVTTLIGTQRVAEEILGYMVNDTKERRLITYTPDWYDEIIENKKNGKKTLLFIDELSQAPENVQGAMLQLIFDRRVGGKKNFLPDDTLIVSAANYKGNIPPQCSIQAPTLNRFVIVNINPEDNIGLIDEFLQTPEERESNLPKFMDIPITPEISNTLRTKLKTTLKDLMTSYDETIRVDNQMLNEIFDTEGDIYNFISGRTIDYLYQIMEGLVHFGLVRHIYRPTIEAHILGLMGAGTCSFRDPLHKVDGDAALWKANLLTKLEGVLTEVITENTDEIRTKLNFDNKTVSDAVSEWMRAAENDGTIVHDTNLTMLIKKIQKEYPSDVTGIEKVLKNWDVNKVLNDYQKIITLYTLLQSYNMVTLNDKLEDLGIIKATYEGYIAATRDDLVEQAS